MNKKYLMFLFLYLFMFIPKVDALRPEEIIARNICPNIELAIAKSDGSLENVSCHETYDEAKNIMNTTENDDLVIIESGLIIDAKYAVIDYEIGYPSSHPRNYSYIYPDKDAITNIGYIVGGSPDDAALIEYDYATKRVKIKVSGLTGWMDLYDETGLQLYYIVPLSWATSVQYYEVNDSEIIHYFPINVYGANSRYGLTLDKKPIMLNQGIYYSYDGNYFYTDMKTLLNDYRNNNYNNAVNKDKPYYNYYQYLSFRTKTNYTAENINDYIKTRVGNKNSNMINSGELFINAQNNYGINAILMLAIGINESGTGTSNIALSKNNLFGLNAVDKTPGESANYFTSVEDCIGEFAYKWLSYGFIQPGDSRFRGSNLGNKYQGLNVKYASDPFWGEKAASIYYTIDKSFDFQDYNTVATAILNSDYENTVYAKKTPNGDNVYTEYYQYRQKGLAVSVFGEEIGPSVNGDDVWYKIQSDPTLDLNLNYIGDSKSNPRINYLWNTSYVYVPRAYFTRINDIEYPVIIPSNNENNNENNENNSSNENDQEPIPEEPKPEPKKISAIVSEASYNYSNGIMSGIKPNTSIETIKNNLTNTGGVITITDANGNIKEAGNIGTGDKINITSGTTETLTVLIYGDINGDSKIDKSDCAEVLRQYYGYIKYSDIKKISSDINKDGKIDKVDASQILRQYYGYASIEQ